MALLLTSYLSGVKRAMAERSSMMFSSCLHTWWNKPGGTLHRACQTWWKEETNLQRIQ